MVACDEDALKCDLAEVYHIFDYVSLPIQMVATFSLGLRADSRIMMKLNGEKLPLNTKLMSLVLDSLSLLVWFQSEDGAKKRNRPPSVYKQLAGDVDEDSKKVDSFATAEDFEKAKQKIIDQAKGG